MVGASLLPGLVTGFWAAVLVALTASPVFQIGIRVSLTASPVVLTIIGILKTVE